VLVSSSILFYNVIVKNTPPLGPAPTPAHDPDADALDPARRRVLRALADQADGLAVGGLAAAVGGHANTTRHHLRGLVEAGLVATRRTTTAGRGRPANVYAVTAAGRAVLAGGVDSAAEEYVALAGAFAERLAERGGDPGEDARAIGRAWGTGLAASDRHGKDGGAAAGRRSGGHSGGRSGARAEAAVVGLLDRLGFSPQVEPDGVLLRTCPLLDAARRHPEVVCQVHLGLVDGALAAHGVTASGARLEPFARPGACVLTLSPDG
jgi:predicted ArsR family transcriptional regulator